MRGEHLDTQDLALVSALDVDNVVGKVVVRVNFTEKGRFAGLRQRITSNFIQTGGLVRASDLAAPRHMLVGT
jgi:hypothetical protein